jgi:hypothetical protein
MPSVISQPDDANIEAKMIAQWIAIALGVALLHWVDRVRREPSF